ncbi:MAG TPA: methyltransferase domain-containing protein [Myxococcaceae bacterium]
MPANSPRFHDAYQPQNVLGRGRLYMNWGLWEADTRELDDAAEALVRRIGELAGLGSESVLLDVGFGFGDQLLHWCRHANLGHAEGLNICPEQTAFARRRIEEAGLSDRVRLQIGDALEPPFAEGTFDAVTAVECAFHFASRERFFQQAGRVLKDGGRLVLADFISTPAPGLRERLAHRLTSATWHFPVANFCTPAAYVETLRGVGFRDISLEPITDRVIPPGRAWARRRLWDADLRRRMDRGAWLATAAVLGLSRLLGDPPVGEYVLVRAVR